jgi:ubiquinone/menaquinone biosynthesis C-methylase UbiE
MVQSTLQISGQEREKWIRRNSYYYRCLVNHLKFTIPEGSSILEIGCGTGFLLEQLSPKRGVGIDTSSSMIGYARQHRGQFMYFIMDAEQITLEETFDFIVISDTIGYFNDVQKVFEEVQKVCTPQTRIVISYTNFLWLPFLNFAEAIGLKMPQKRQNWLDISDIANLLTLANFDVIRKTKKNHFSALPSSIILVFEQIRW